jgi:hypothetical protein
MIAVALGAVAVAAPAIAATSFDDVPPSHPFHEDITWLAGTGITSGYPDGGYHPNDPVTRQAMAAFLRRLAGADPGVDPVVDAATLDSRTPTDFDDAKTLQGVTGADLDDAQLLAGRTPADFDNAKTIETIEGDALRNHVTVAYGGLAVELGDTLVPSTIESITLEPGRYLLDISYSLYSAQSSVRVACWIAPPGTPTVTIISNIGWYRHPRQSARTVVQPLVTTTYDLRCTRQNAAVEVTSVHFAELVAVRIDTAAAG